MESEIVSFSKFTVVWYRRATSLKLTDRKLLCLVVIQTFFWHAPQLIKLVPCKGPILSSFECEEKSRTQRRAREEKVLTDQLQMVGVSLDSDWCQKAFLFSCPITKQQDQEPSRFASSYKIDTSWPVARDIFTREKNPNHSTNRSGISARNSPVIRWTFHRYRHNVSVFKDCEVLYTYWCRNLFRRFGIFSLS